MFGLVVVECKGYLSIEYENTLNPEEGTRQSLINLRKILGEINWRGKY